MIIDRSAPLYPFRGLRSVHSITACMLTKSPNETLYTGGLSGFIASAAAPIVTGWGDPVPGWDLHPVLTIALSRCTTMVGFWVAEIFGHLTDNSYLGIIFFLILPAMFLLGLTPMPIGVLWRRGKLQRVGLSRAK